MANPLKVLTQLSASKEAQFADVVEMQKTVTVSGAEAHLRVTGGGEISGSGELKIAGASQLGSTLAVQGDANLASKLDVKGASALSGTLGVVGAADLQSTLAVAGAADLNGALDVQGAANFQSNVGVSGSLKSVGEISGSAALNIGGAAHIIGAAQLDSTLNVSGNVQLDANLNVDGAADFDSTLDVAGNVTFQASASIQGDLVVQGDLFVEGTRTFLNTNELRVEDKNILIASSSMPVDSSTADGAGITVMGSTTNKEFKWLDATQAWTSSEHMDLAAGKVYKIAGEEVLAKDASATKLSLNGGSAQIAVSSSTVAIAGDLVLADDLHVSGTLGVDGVATFTSDITASANVDVAGNINVAESKGYYINNTKVLDLNGEEEGRVALSYGDGSSRVTVENGAINLVSDGDNNRSLDMWSASAQFNNVDLTVAGGDASFLQDIKVYGISELIGDISGSAGLDLAGAAHIAGAVDMDSTLNVDGVATFASDITASANVDVAGNIHAHGGKIELDRVGDFAMVELDGFAAIYANSANELGIADGALSFNRTSGVASFGSDITASAGLDVAAAAHFAAAVDIDGELNVDGGAIKSHGAAILVQSSAGSDLFITRDFENAASSIAIDSNDNVKLTSATGVIRATSNVGIEMSGSFGVDGQADFQDAAAFHADVAMDAALNLSGSTFINIATPVDGATGKYNVNDAIRALDAKAGQQASDINSSYAALRYLASASFDGNGMAAFTSSFAAASIHQVTVDVLVQAGGIGAWTNDLVSVQVKEAGLYVGFEISAPAMGASDKVRIIAVKESGSLA